MIKQGNCLHLMSGLESGSIAAVITDPPYSSGGRTAAERSAPVAGKYVQHGSKRFQNASFEGDNRDQRSWAHWCALWLAECYRVTKEGGYCLVFSDWRQLPALTDAIQAGGWIWRGIISWDKTEAARAPNPSYFRHQCEYIVWGTRGTTHGFSSTGGPWPGCYRVPVLQRDKFHVTGKPTELMRRLVRIVQPGETVLDPFAGSGTTGVAAKIEGRQFIGFELDPEHAQVARGRIRRAKLDPHTHTHTHTHTQPLKDLRRFDYLAA